MIGQRSGFSSLAKLMFGAKYRVFDVSKVESALDLGLTYSENLFGDVYRCMYGRI